MNLYEQRLRQTLDLHDNSTPPAARIEPVLGAAHYGWLTLGIVVYAALVIGIAFGITAISTGLRNRKALYSVGYTLCRQGDSQR